MSAFAAKRVKSYEVVTPNAPCFEGRFSPELLARFLNASAKHDWRVISASLVRVPYLVFFSRLELMIILERDY